MVVRLLSLRAGRTLLPGKIPDTHSAAGKITDMKNSIISSDIEPATFLLAA
jgi:hypothetical protein